MDPDIYKGENHKAHMLVAVIDGMPLAEMVDEA